MNMTKTLGLLCSFLLLSACAATGGAADSRKLSELKYPADQVTLLGFIATGKPGEEQLVYDRQKNNEEGTAIIRHNYMAASGNSCRTYYWLPAGVQEKAGAHNLNVACRTASGKWVKVRTLSNIESFFDKEPLGYVLH